jgi:protein TonB
MSEAVQAAWPEGSVSEGDQDASWLKWVGVAVLVVAVLGLLGWLIKSVGSGSSAGPKHQTVKIAVLPDMPPPPPPKEEPKKEPPKDQPKQTMQMDQPKVAQAPPQPSQSLKMEGAAGDGPSAFQQGSVSNEYSKGQVISGGTTGQASAGDRAKFMFYANSARQLLRGELEKNLAPEVLELGARLQVWVSPDGSISRYQILGLGKREAEAELRKAMDQAVQSYRMVPPVGMPQPMDLQLKVNAQAG